MLPVGLVDLLLRPQQAICNQPRLKRVWVFELLLAGHEVDRIDESLHEAEVAGGGLPLRHGILVYP